MAKLNKQTGSIVARCPGCSGGKSAFVWRNLKGEEFGAITSTSRDNRFKGVCNVDFRLFRCTSCNEGAYGVILYDKNHYYPGSENSLVNFYPESKQRLDIPPNTPPGIAEEFREAEKCFDDNYFRAAASLFRSVLDKTMKANGYKTCRRINLYQQIEAAAKDGIITQARKKRAHDDIRVLGNDVLHEEWKRIPEEDVRACRHYCQRILEDLYVDREVVLELLKEAKREPEDLQREES